MKVQRAVSIACLPLWLITGVAYAHHSFVSFDMKKTVQFTGVVREFNWTNPHSYIMLETVDSNGRTVDATLEANGPGYLVRQGWKRDTLQPGDKITVMLHPMRDGSPGGDLVGVTLASGRHLSAEPKLPGSSQNQPAYAPNANQK